MAPHVDLWCDGSGGRTGTPGGWGCILIAEVNGEKIERELYGGAVATTNNQMELLAATKGFEELKFPCDVTVHSDSEYVIKAFTDNWIAKWRRKNWLNVKNVPYWQRLIAAQAPHQVTWEWVKGHSKVRLNERCDKLAGNCRLAIEAAMRQGGGETLHMLDFAVEDA